LQIKNYIFTLCVLLSVKSINCQGFYDDYEKCKLFEKGVKKVTISKSNVSREIWLLDSSKLTIIEYSLVPKGSNEMAILVDSNYYSDYFTKSFYNSLCAIDSSLSVNFVSYFSPPNDSTIYNSVDTTKVYYFYNKNDSKLNSIKVYSGKSIYRQDYFNYDESRRLISKVINENNRESYISFEYDDNSRIIKEVLVVEQLSPFTVTFKYDDSGNLMEKKTSIQQIIYNYENNFLVKRVINNGLDSEVWSYKYEF
jgi:hypothetical protein